MDQDPSLVQFRQAVLGPDHEIDLARAALLIATTEHPGLDVARYLARLDGLADRARIHGSDADPLVRLHRLREFLFAIEAFRGNAENYFDPRNSFLNDVLERKLGIPITLSLVMMEVGRRLGLEIEGIGLPGHFVVGLQAENGRILLDPFHGGAPVTREECHEAVSRVLGHAVTLTEAHFAPVSKRQFLARLLRNLKAIYWRREEWARALPVMERLLALEPDTAGELRDRGVVLVNLGRLRPGIADLEDYLRRSSQASDADVVRAHLRRARHTLASLN